MSSRRSSSFPAFVVVLGLLVGLVSGSPSGAETGAGSVRYERPVVGATDFVSGLAKPWDLAFTPDGTLLFTLKSGEIMARIGDELVVMGKPPDVLVAGEGGMMGLAVDPGFATNRRIYTCMLASPTDGPDDVRVVRWRVASNFGSLSERSDIVTGIDINTTAPGSLGRHSGCRPRFGPDGNLWIGTGDAAMPTTPQDPNSLAGKVLRVDTDGEGLPGNAGEPFRPEIYSYGHRNVQGIAFRPSDGKPYSVEHGTHVDDEVNALVAGGNYGWDPVDPGSPDEYDESAPMTDLDKFPDAVPPVWSSGDTTIATSGATFVQGSAWLGWNDSLVIATLNGQRLLALTFDAAGTRVVEETQRLKFPWRFRSVVQGPDGNLYVSQDENPGSILRVTPEPRCGAGQPGPFPDVAGTSPFCREVTWGEQESVITGREDGRFLPREVLTRQAFAWLLSRFNKGSGWGGSGPFFSDVPEEHPAYHQIQWLSDDDIADGFPDGTFRPRAPVARQALASFLYRYAGRPEVDGSADPGFSDVPVGHPFHDAVVWMVDQGYAVGYDDGTFGPTEPVTRQSAAAFLQRAEGLRPIEYW